MKASVPSTTNSKQQDQSSSNVKNRTNSVNNAQSNVIQKGIQTIASVQPQKPNMPRSNRIKDEETKSNGVGAGINHDQYSNEYLSDYKKNQQNQYKGISGNPKEPFQLPSKHMKDQLAPITKVGRPGIDVSRDRDYKFLEDGQIDHTLQGELLNAQKEIIQLKKQLHEKEKELEKEREEKIKLRSENMVFKQKVARLTEIAKNNLSSDHARQNPRPNRDQDTGVDEMLRQVQMAMVMNDMETRMKERQMLHDAMQRASHQAVQEEERLLQAALEESKAMAQDPNNPDVDNMTYEELMALQERTGIVSRGLTKAQIESIKPQIWLEGKTKSTECHICIEKFARGKKFKNLKCGHEYHADCIDEWLNIEKRCPVCNGNPI